MFVELFLAAFALACGQALFAHFEERTSPWRRLAKVLIVVGGVAIVSWVFGRYWSLSLLLAFLLLGISVHIWWTRKHGIDPWTAAPRDEYYRLRGWS